MPLNFRDTLVGCLFPEYLAGRFVERVDLPRVFRIVFRWSDVAEESEARLVFAGTDCADDEYLVAPNDGTRVRQAGDRRFPTDIEGGGGVKFYGLCRSFGDSRCARTTKLRPVLCVCYGSSRSDKE